MKLALFLVGLLVAESRGYSGHVDGNGTGGLKLKDGTVKVYDLWEGENQSLILNIDPDLSYGWYPTTIREVLDRLNDNFLMIGSVVRECYWHVKKHHRFLPEGITFAPPSDIDPTVLPEDAELIRIASMTDSKEVLIDRKHWEKLTAWQREIVFVHEAIYLVQREVLKITDSSLYARKIVACIFSESCDVVPRGELLDLKLKQKPGFGICSRPVNRSNLPSNN